MARISKRNGSQTVTDASGRITGNLPGLSAPTVAVVFSTLPQKGDVRISPKTGKEQRWTGGEWRNLCAECLTEGREEPKGAKSGGVCVEHGARTPRCGVCLEEGREHPKRALAGGVCVEHGYQQPRCVVCVEEGREHPKRALAGGVCVEHGYQHPRCAVCVEEGRKEPKGAQSGGVCVEHGARTPRCVACLEEGRDNPKQAQSGGVCKEHGARTPRCSICVEEGREHPKQALAGGLCKEHWPRCRGNSCTAGATPGGSGLCSFHEEHGPDAVNDYAWQRRVYRLYCVEYPNLGWVKIGVEASKPSRRVKQWVKAGGVLVDEITLDKEDLAAGRGAVLASIEASLHGHLLPAMFDRVDPGLYAATFRDADFKCGPTDGYAETYEAGDWSVIWGLVQQAADDADLWRVGD